MSEKFSKTGLSSGSSWSLFAENTAFEESDGIVTRLGNSADTTRLHYEDLNRFGQCPSQQSLKLVACKQCKKLLLFSSVQRHYELKHNKLLSSVKPSPPKRCTPATVHSAIHPKASFSKSKVLKSSNKSFIRIEEINHHEANVKIEEVPLTIPQFNSTTAKVKLPKISLKKLTSENKKGIDRMGGMSSPQQLCIQVKGNIKKIPQMKDKEYDVDKHCGVWIPEIEKNCTRSLTCKTHPLSMRRQVPGRSKDFDDLLADHRNRVKLQDNTSNASSSPQSNSRGGTPVHSPFGIDKIVFPTVTGPSSINYHKDMAGPNLKSPRSASLKSISDDNGLLNGSRHTFVDFVAEDMLCATSLPTMSYHPKPIRINNFGARQTDCNCRIFSRKMDHFRNVTSPMLDRFNNAVFTCIKQSKNPAKTGEDGIRSAVQDPLQNGIIHKQKTKSKQAGLKRPSNESHSGTADLSMASIKRRHSSDVPVVVPFGLTNQPNSLSRSLSTPGSQHALKFQKCTENGTLSGVLHRPKTSGNEFVTNTLEGRTNLTFVTSIANNPLTNKFVGVCAASHDNFNSSLTSGSSVCSPALTPQQQHLSESPYSSSKSMAAPNVTITPGMIVSLPNAVLQSTQAYPQIKELISQSTPTKTVQPVKVLNESNLSVQLTNGILPSMTSSSSTVDTKGYSISFCTSQEPAPNVTVTASPSLTGVLQGHGVTVSPSLTGVLQGHGVTASPSLTGVLQGHGVNKSPYKRLNSNHNSETTLLQQMIVQQTNRDVKQQHQMTVGAAYKQTSNHPTISQSIQSTQHINNLTNVQASPIQTFLNSPNHGPTSLPNNQPMKQLQKMQLQQIQNQQFITMHHGYQQQILPKLPTVPQNINQYTSQQFSPAATPNLQLISQTTGNNSIQ